MGATVVTDVPSKETIACSLIEGGNVIVRDIVLGGKLINKVSLEGLFPEAKKDSYYKISCSFKSNPVKASLFIGRTVDSKHSSIEAMD